MSATGIYTASGGYNFGAGNLGIYAPNGGFNLGSQNVLNPANYGVTSNGKVLSDGTTGASAVVSSASYNFTQADVGKVISIPGALAVATGNPNGVLNTTISSVSNDKATLAVAATQTLSGTAVITFGTDDTVNFQTMVTAAGALPNGGTILLPSAVTIITSIGWLSNVSCFGQGWNCSILKHIKTTDAVGAMFLNNVGGAANITNCQFQNFQMDMSAATATGGYQVNAGCIRILQAQRLSVSGCYFNSSPATCLAFDYGQRVVIQGNILENYGFLAAAGALGGAGVGCGVNPTSQWVVANNVFLSPTDAHSNYGVFFEAESAASAAGAAIVADNVFVGTGILAAIGDAGLRRFICTGNHIDLAAVNTNTGAGILVIGGTTGFVAGIRGLIANNMIVSTPGDGIGINLTAGIDAGQYLAYQIVNNHIQAATGHGIKITAAAAAVLKTIHVSGNFLDSNKLTGITFIGAGGFQDITCNDNVCLNNGANGTTITAVGIAFNTGAVARLTMVGNDCYDNNAGAQKYGLGVGATVAITGAFISDNNFLNNATGSINIISGGSIAGILTNNPGYNPVGASNASPGASPWTFTAPNSPGTLYLDATISITALTQNGSSILPAATGALALLPVPFNANDVIVVTYTGTLTANKMVN